MAKKKGQKKVRHESWSAARMDRLLPDVFLKRAVIRIYYRMAQPGSELWTDVPEYRAVWMQNVARLYHILTGCKPELFPYRDIAVIQIHKAFRKLASTNGNEDKTAKSLAALMLTNTVAVDEKIYPKKLGFGERDTAKYDKEAREQLQLSFAEEEAKDS